MGNQVTVLYNEQLNKVKKLSSTAHWKVGEVPYYLLLSGHKFICATYNENQRMMMGKVLLCKPK